MYCEKCGSYVEGDSKFCPVCGAAVNAAASQDAAANPDSVRKSVAAATKQQSLNETKAHLKSAVPAGSKDDGIAISKKELKEWRDLFPNLSDKEISKLYKESAKK